MRYHPKIDIIDNNANGDCNINSGDNDYDKKQDEQISHLHVW